MSPPVVLAGRGVSRLALRVAVLIPPEADANCPRSPGTLEAADGNPPSSIPTPEARLRRFLSALDGEPDLLRRTLSKLSPCSLYSGAALA